MKKRTWLKAAGVRAIRTVAQTAGAMIAVGATMSEVGWVNVISVSLVAGIASMLTSLAGLPEVDGSDESD